jgi:hypothetical protein
MLMLVMVGDGQGGEKERDTLRSMSLYKVQVVDGAVPMPTERKKKSVIKTQKRSEEKG